MKKIGKLLGIIAFAAIIGFSMAACNEDGTIATLSGEIEIDPADKIIALGTEITATYKGSEKVTTYEWKKGIGTISAGPSNKFTPTETGTYTVTINVTGFAPKISKPFAIAKILTGTITISPSDDVFINTELTATYSGSDVSLDDLKYQWKKGLILSTDVQGATSNKFKPTEAGYYTVTVSAEDFFKNSDYVYVATPLDKDLTGTLTITPADATTETELTATYSGDEDVKYQWKKDSAIVQGETNAKFKPTETGFYSVTVSAEGYKSKSAYINVSAPSLKDLAGTLTITVTTTGGKTKITAAYSGTESVTYQWKKGTTNVQGATSAEFTPTETGYYTVIISASGYKSKASNGNLITVTQ